MYIRIHLAVTLAVLKNTCTCRTVTVTFR